MRPLPRNEVFRRLVAVRDRVLVDPGSAPLLAGLAREAGMSRFHFLRMWKEAFGVTPHEDITRLRIARAKSLLMAENTSVTEVCFEVGFTSLGSFSTLFAERAGCPPTAWRRRYHHVTANLDKASVLVPWCFTVRLASCVAD